MINRRDFLKQSAAATAGVIVGNAISRVIQGASEDPRSLQDMSLAELARSIRPDFLIGAHLNPRQMTDDPENRKPQSLIAREYNLVSAGIYQKQIQRRSRDEWNFSGPDAIIDFAKRNRLAVYAHPMFGSDNYLPDWLRYGGYSDEVLLDIIEERIKTILTRYKGRIHIVDVYNEGFSRTAPGWRTPDNLFLSMGYRENEIGRWPVFLERILIWCREYGGEDLKLIYNDNNNTLPDMPQTLECIQLHAALKKADIPIDGIGIQCHTQIGQDDLHRLGGSRNSRNPAFHGDLFAQNLKRMGEAGINTYISECDVHLYGEIDQRKLEIQAKAYRSMLKACIEEPCCKAFKTWGYSDASCWMPMKKNNPGYDYEPYPLPFDHEFEPKPAYHAMKDLLIEIIEHNEM
jgi:endo-1,4-beta-xylanase